MRLPDRTGFRGKTLWDWLQLLIVPAILIGVTFAWSFTQTKADNKREDRRIDADVAAAERVRQDTTLNGYFQQMSDLMLENKLRSSKRADPVRSVAYTVTVTTLRRLDGERKGEVVRFLQNAGLINGERPVFGLGGGADLTGASLVEADLVHAYLQGAELTRADLTGANLILANLMEADLEGAVLKGADLIRANLQGADLTGADLSDANLSDADLSDANLSDANLTNAKLEGAENLDLDDYIRSDLSSDLMKIFLDSQRAFLDSLSREELSKFNLSPEKLAAFRREAAGP